MRIQREEIEEPANRSWRPKDRCAMTRVKERGDSGTSGLATSRVSWALEFAPTRPLGCCKQPFHHRRDFAQAVAARGRDFARAATARCLGSRRALELLPRPGLSTSCTADEITGQNRSSWKERFFCYDTNPTGRE